MWRVVPSPPRLSAHVQVNNPRARCWGFCPNCSQPQGPRRLGTAGGAARKALLPGRPASRRDARARGRGSGTGAGPWAGPGAGLGAVPSLPSPVGRSLFSGPSSPRAAEQCTSVKVYYSDGGMCSLETIQNMQKPEPRGRSLRRLRAAVPWAAAPRALACSGALGRWFSPACVGVAFTSSVPGAVRAPLGAPRFTVQRCGLRGRGGSTPPPALRRAWQVMVTCASVRPGAGAL